MKVFAVLIASAFGSLYFPCVAFSADATSIEDYLEKILSSSAGEDIGVIQQSAVKYQVRVKTGLLFDAFQLRPNEGLLPKETRLAVRDHEDGSWSFSANSRYASGFSGAYDEDPVRTVLNAGNAEVEGLFDPNPGRTSHFSLGYKDGLYEIEFDKESIKTRFDSLGLTLKETTGADRLSRVTVDARIGSFTLDDREGGRPTAFLQGRSSTYSFVAEGLNYRSLKGKLIYGDRIELHSSENEADYPLHAVQGMSRYQTSLRSEGISSMEGAEGMRAEAIDIRASGNLPSETSKNEISIDVTGFDFIGTAARSFYLPLIPKRITASGTLTGMDFRMLYLMSNIFSRVGKNNDLAYLQRGTIPGETLTLTGAHVSLSNENYTLDLKGDFSININTGKILSAKIEARSSDLDRILEINRPRASKDQVAGSLQFMLYFLKGASRTEANGATVWTVTSKDGEFYLNDRIFNL